MNSVQTDQTEVVAFLSDPATYGDDAPVEVITTHSAHVFLVGELAFKIKRSVRYNYLDFTSLEKRRKVIEHELVLNAPTAPAIYDRVVAITREASGGLTLDGTGTPIEYALQMRRFPREDELVSIADAGELTNDLAVSLGSAIADFHAVAARRTEDGAVLIREIVDELREAFAGMEATLGQDRLSEYFRKTKQTFEDVAPMLTQRSTEGFVRRCHGDLHLKNLVMLEGRPVPFDALEFDERLGTCDVFYDFGFLIMDLLHRGLQDQANTALNSYLHKSGDFAGLSALPLFMSVRAAIRSMVTVQTMSAPASGEIALDARNYLDHSIRYLTPSPPRLLAIGGLSGTGKTTIAASIAPELWPAPGAVHLRSDLVRKALFGADPLERLPDNAYRPGTSRDVYARLLNRAERVLRVGHSVVVDATFLEQSYVTSVRSLADRLHVKFDGIWLHANPATLERRVAARTGDASDADVDVLHAQLEHEAAPAAWTKINSSGTVDQVVELVKASLFRVLPAAPTCI
jgi:aminoglycoside phosphotransferase family enzyme/predicted kinase